MSANSPQPTLYFVIFLCVFLSTYFNEDRNEIFDDSHVGFILFIENIFIIDEYNDRTCHLDDDAKGGFDNK